MASTHQVVPVSSNGTGLASNPGTSSTKGSDSLQAVGTAARAVHLSSFDRRSYRAKRYKGVSAAAPRSSDSAAETRRTQKGRAIAEANFWFEAADTLSTSALAPETTSTSEVRPPGFEQKSDTDPVAGSPVALGMPLTVEDAETALPVALGQAEAFHQDGEILPLATVGHILAGWLPIDLPALERKVDAFFSQIEKLGEEATDVLISSRLTPWLVIGTITVGVSYALARRHLKVPALEGVRSSSDPRSREWTWLSNGAVLPPWEKP
jgi:hypothetical protein